jgi:folylpolyglutamate synthase
MKVPHLPFHDLCASYSRVWKDIDPYATIAVAPTIEKAVHLAREIGIQENNVDVLVTGSLYMVGGALRFLRPPMYHDMIL